MSDFTDYAAKVNASLAEIGRRHNQWMNDAIKRIDAALADAEPAPTGEAEYPEQPLAEWERELLVQAGEVIGHVDDAPVSGQGEMVEHSGCDLPWSACPACFRDSDTPAAEPQRVTLPDTPADWTIVEVTDTDGDMAAWRAYGGEWHYFNGTHVPLSMLARVVDFTILAEPPKADPADTDAQEYERAYDELVADISDRAAKRVRDEALDDLYSALDVAYALATPDTSADELARLLRERVGAAIERNREQGGDGR